MNEHKSFLPLFEQKAFGLIFLTFVMLINVDCIYSQRTRSTEPKNADSERQNKSENSLVGRWQSDEATVVIRDDGTVSINDEEFSYRIKNSVIIVSGDEGSMSFPFAFQNGKLIVEVEGREVVYSRVKNDAKQSDGRDRSGGALPELVGKWCYMSNLTGSNARMANRCFTLYANGTYEYYAETSSSGSVASSASQESDSGRWTATSNALTAYSNSYGKIVYRLERRNHPKTGDPMLIVDGDAYVTAYQKQPW